MNALKTTTIAALSVLALTLGAAAHAADKPATDPAKAASAPRKARTPQQEKMSACSKQSKGKKGDERRAFMHECLSAQAAKPVAGAKPASAAK